MSFILAKFFFLFFFLSNIFAHDCISFSQAKNILEGFPSKPITEIENDISLEKAYCAQEKINYLLKKKFNDKVGYKVGFTGKKLQERFKINRPATGIIYKHMFIPNGSTLAKDFGYRTFIEPDLLAIIKSSEIMQAKSKIDILDNVESFHPYLELPALRFEKGVEVNGNMLIASNMLATKMIMAEGIKIPADKDGVNKLSNINTIFLDSDNNIIQKASTSNLMGNPLNVLKWLINDFNKRGITLNKGDKISLGSVGKIFPLEKNSYKYYFEGFEEKQYVININVN